MLIEQMKEKLARIAQIQQDIFEKENELAALLGLGQEPVQVSKIKLSRTPSRTHRIHPTQKKQSREKLVQLIRNLVADGGLITQLVVVANARTAGIVTNAQQAAAVLRQMTERGELIAQSERNVMGEVEYRRI